MPALRNVPTLRTHCVFAVAVLWFGLLAGCSGKGGPNAPAGPATTWLGVSPNPAPGESIQDVVFTLRATGVNFFYHSPTWDEFETAPGVYATAELRNVIASARALGAAVYVNVRTIDTNQRRFPSDLQTLALDDPLLVARVDQLVDTLIAVAREQPLVALALGNEVDAYFGAHPAEFAAFRALFERAVIRLHAALPGLPVGIATISPILNPNAAYGDQLHALADLAIYTYYPFESGSDFVHRAPATFEGDLAAMKARIPGKPFALQEVGYSSSTTNGGSDSLQADFARRFRNHVRTSLRSELVFANWFLYTDLPPALVDTLIAYYGFDTPGFRAYLGNLGLRRVDGTPKPSWTAWTAAP